MEKNNAQSVDLKEKLFRRDGFPEKNSKLHKTVWYISPSDDC
jgi:hypothetical protein